ncbi:erythromycin esterase family protein [Streptomyces mayteni]
MATDELIYPALARFLDERPHPPRVLGLGEPVHGVDTFLRLRDELLHGLVARRRTRCVALESDCLAGHLVDDHVRGGDGHLDQVLADGITHGWGAWAGNRALVEWLAAHNRARPLAEQVRFAGFDAPTEITGAESPRAALWSLHAFLTAHLPAEPHPWSRIDALLGDDDRWTNPDVMYEPTRGVGRSAEARELRAIADDLRWLLASAVPRLAAQGADGTAEALFDAELAARTAAGLLAYHAVLAGTDHHERLTNAIGIRDTMMAANLEALAARDHDHGPVLAFASNQHLRRGTAWMRMGGVDLWWSPAGAHLARALGPEYVTIAIAIGSAPHLGIHEPPADTVEGRLLAAGPSAPRLVPAAELVELVAGATALTKRPAEYFAYFPLDPDALDDFDAVLFLPRLEPSEDDVVFRPDGS